MAILVAAGRPCRAAGNAVEEIIHGLDASLLRAGMTGVQDQDVAGPWMNVAVSPEFPLRPREQRCRGEVAEAAIAGNYLSTTVMPEGLG